MVVGAATRVVLYGLLWVVLTGDARLGWGLGVPTIAAATAAGLGLRTQTRWRMRIAAIARFTGYFARESLLGAWDVARRALDPARPISPVLLPHRLRLPAGAPQSLFIAAVSLLPGTLAATHADGCVLVHSLRQDPAVTAELTQLEHRIAAVFGVGLSPAEERDR